MYSIYAIRVTPLGMAYYGSTGNFQKRAATHRSQLKNGRHHCANLQDAFNRFGAESMTYEVVQSGLTKEVAHQVETELIRRPDALNIGRHAQGGDNLTRHPKKNEIVTNRNLTQAAKIAQLDDESRKAKWGRQGSENGMYGRTHSPEVKARLSEMAKSRKPALGHKHTEETKARLSVMASERTGERNHFFGKRHGDAAKEKLRLARTGNKPANSRPVICDGAQYESATEAGRRIGVCTATILFRIKSKHWDYKYA